MDIKKEPDSNATGETGKKRWTAPEIRELNAGSTLSGPDTHNKEGDSYNPPAS